MEINEEQVSSRTWPLFGPALTIHDSPLTIHHSQLAK